MGAMLTIGILGGSFNPAHEAHLAVSLMLLKRLRLHQIWWMVSPQNPLKPIKGMADFAMRMQSARHIARHPRIHVSDFEQRHQTRFTADTLRLLRLKYPRYRFVWLMGADNLAQFHRWKGWVSIFKTTAIAVYDRAPYTHKAMHSKAAQRFVHHRTTPEALTNPGPPAWTFLYGKREKLSATHLRNLLGSDAFLRHNRKCD